MNYVKGNNEMYKYEENGWSIRGLHDATHGEIVIEVKTRMRAQNVKKNEYDLYQLFGYLLAMNKTKEHMQMYYIGNESANGDELKELRKENLRFWKDVMLEDINAIEGMQEGRNSPVYNGGNFSPIMDQPTHQFHKWVANSLI